MVGFFWDIRGFNKSTKQEVVRNWLRDHSILFGCLIETRVKENKAAKIVGEVFKYWSYGELRVQQIGQVMGFMEIRSENDACL